MKDHPLGQRPVFPRYMEMELAAYEELLPKFQRKSDKAHKRFQHHLATTSCASNDSRVDYCDTCWRLSVRSDIAMSVLNDLKATIARKAKYRDRT